MTQITRTITITAGAPSITLYSLPSPVAIGDTVVFKGDILKSDGTPVVGEVVGIWIVDKYRWLKNADGSLVLANSDSSGYYSVSWVVWNQDGVLLGAHTFQAYANNYQVWSNTRPMTIVGPLTVTFSADKTSGPVPLAVTFSCGASGGVLNYTWTLDPGDGSAPYSGTRTAEGTWTQAHTYNTGGAFTAVLTVTDALGASIASRLQVGAGVPIIDWLPLLGVAVPLVVIIGGAIAWRMDLI